MKFTWPFKPVPPETTPPETPLPVDHEGIPILNEVVEPTELGLIDSADPNQANLPLFDPDWRDGAATPSIDLKQLREQLRREMLEAIEQVADSVTERFRADLERTLREEIDRVLDERLPPPTSPDQDRRLD
ncbi:hypothetical protein [Sedimenticola selenatireducens]|uniref:hypothetical protein n=1 Tax=Sedimenticola selenatireducens TaxID=191960 RepID=UPI00048F3793|nr:hypothetical protein [Sedimenticola selenatireducens]